jgi:hypothetical protein
MSTVSKRTVTATRHEYVVPSPAARIDVEKAIAWALKDMPEGRRRYDDACIVEARDDEIVIWWPEGDS